MLILNLICSFDILVLRSIIVDVRNSGLRATGIQRICGHWLIVIIVAVFLEVLLLSLNFVDLFFDLLNLSTDLAITSTVRTRIASLLMTVCVLLCWLHVMMLDLRLRNLWKVMLFVFIVLENVSIIVIFFVCFFPYTCSSFLWHAHIQSCCMGSTSHLWLGWMSMRL